MERRRQILPYYMSYPVSMENGYYSNENGIIENERNEIGSKSERDRDYFRQMYPPQIRQYLRSVSNIVDTVAGRESFIYDEYPDYVRLERLVEVIMNTLPIQSQIPRESEKHIIRILLYDEIYRRRNTGTREGL